MDSLSARLGGGRPAEAAATAALVLLWGWRLASLGHTGMLLLFQSCWPCWPAGLPQSTLMALLATLHPGDLKRMPADAAAWVLVLAAHARCRRTDSRVQACYQELKRSSSRMR